MAKQKYSQDEIITGLIEVFRNVGYEGASLEELSKASGLKKSSLYHRFPEGKKQMAAAVLRAVGKWVKENISNVLFSEIAPERRLEKVIKNIDQLYAGGKKTCILRALSMDAGAQLFPQLINQAFVNWISGFTKLGLDFGFSEESAKRMAQDVVIKVQGSLIVGKGTNDPILLKRSLREIKQQYLIR